MFWGYIQQRIIAGKQSTVINIKDRIDQDRKKSKKHIIKLEHQRIKYWLTLESSNCSIPPFRNDHNEILVEIVEYEIRVSSIVFLSIEQN